MISPVSPQAAATELLRRRRARSSLLEFTRYTKPNYQVNWHHELLCRYLDRFVRGEIKRLAVFMPPRHGKSELVSRRLPAYIFGVNPNARIIACSYTADLASRMNRDVQRVLDNPEYNRLFPDTRLWGKNIRTVADGSYLRNNDIFEIVGHQGYYRSAGIGGGITGMGMDFGIIDDPLKDRKSADSPTIRRSQLDWYWSTFYTRLEKGGAILLTMTRWHTHDLAGELLRAMSESDSADQWEVLMLPGLAGHTHHPDDPRVPGAPLWPDKYSRDFLERLRGQNAYEFEALYQQSPKSAGGGLFDTTKIEIVDTSPPCRRVVRFYDLAVTAKASADFTAGLKLGVTDDERFVVLDVWRAQKELPDVQEAIIQNARVDGAEVPIRLEAEKAGIVQLQFLLRDARTRAYTIDAKPPKGDKFTRAGPVATRVNNGRVLLVRAPWNRTFLDELAFFGPSAEHDDQVDALSGAYEMLVGSTVSVSFPEF